MSSSSNAAIPFTQTDIAVGARLVEALVRHARAGAGQPIAYEDLLTLGRLMYPKDAVLGRAVVVGIGAKLQFVDGFCKANAYPSLACLAVNKLTMHPGPGYEGDWDADRRTVAGFDWSDALARLPAYAADMAARVPARLKPRKERPADVAWYAYFCSHRQACARIDGDDKKEIINLLMAGLDPDTALQRVLAAKAALGVAP